MNLESSALLAAAALEVFVNAVERNAGATTFERRQTLLAVSAATEAAKAFVRLAETRGLFLGDELPAPIPQRKTRIKRKQKFTPEPENIEADCIMDVGTELKAEVVDDVE